MSREAVREYLGHVNAGVTATAADADAVLDRIVRAAADSGYLFSRDELSAVLQESGSGELSDADLDAAAGGVGLAGLAVFQKVRLGRGGPNVFGGNDQPQRPGPNGTFVMGNDQPADHG